MKKVLCAAALVLVMTSVASAGWIYPTTVVQSYYPVGPVYAYPASVCVEPTPVVVERPVIQNVVTPVAPACGVYTYPYMVTPQYVIPGIPVDNRIRANRIW